MTLSYVAGKYALLRKIASGGMAEVFLAKQVGIDGFEKLVVLKRILPHLAHQSEYVRMFLDEAKTAADLRHANVVSTFEIGEDQGVYFMVMEFLQGQDVRTLYKKAITDAIEVPRHIAAGIVMDACSGLHYAHVKNDLSGKRLGIVHRDISPQNMIVTYEGETKIVDFGIAKAAHQKNETASGVLKGKYSYMSPEQAQGQQTDHRTDIFALGIVLYEMTTLRRLFRRDAEAQTLKAVIECQVPLPSTFIPEYPKSLERILLRALAKDKERRYASCEDMRMELEEFLNDQRMPHSVAKLGQFMRQLFKDHIEREKLLGHQDREAMSALSWSGSHPSSTQSKKSASNEQHTRIVRTRRRSMLFNQNMALVLLFFGLASLLGTIAWLGTGSSQTPVAEIPKNVALDGDDFFDIKELAPPPSAPTPEPKDVAPPKVEKKEMGRLKVVVDPWAEVYLDNVRIGDTPLAARKLPEGTYEVRLENPKLRKRVSQSITIRPGEDTLVRHVW